MLTFIERRLFSNGMPADSTTSLANKNFKLAGEIMAMSMLQGVQAPNLFSAKVFNYFWGNFLIEDINSSFFSKTFVKR